MLTSHLVTSGQALQIPSVHVHGSRSAQLEQLDSALRQLRAVRRAMAAGTSRSPARSTQEMSARDWWGAGMAFVVMLGLLTIWAWAVRFDVGPSPLRPGAVVHEAF